MSEEIIITKKEDLAEPVNRIVTDFYTTLVEYKKTRRFLQKSRSLDDSVPSSPKLLRHVDSARFWAHQDQSRCEALDIIDPPLVANLLAFSSTAVEEIPEELTLENRIPHLIKRLYLVLSFIENSQVTTKRYGATIEKDILGEDSLKRYCINLRDQLDRLKEQYRERFLVKPALGDAITAEELLKNPALSCLLNDEDIIELTLAHPQLTELTIQTHGFRLNTRLIELVKRLEPAVREQYAEQILYVYYRLIKNISTSTVKTSLPTDYRSTTTLKQHFSQVVLSSAAATAIAFRPGEDRLRYFSLLPAQPNYFMSLAFSYPEQAENIRKKLFPIRGTAAIAAFDLPSYIATKAKMILDQLKTDLEKIFTPENSIFVSASPDSPVFVVPHTPFDIKFKAREGDTLGKFVCSKILAPNTEKAAASLTRFYQSPNISLSDLTTQIEQLKDSDFCYLLTDDTVKQAKEACIDNLQLLLYLLAIENSSHATSMKTTSEISILINAVGNNTDHIMLLEHNLMLCEKYEQMHTLLSDIMGPLPESREANFHLRSLVIYMLIKTEKTALFQEMLKIKADTWLGGFNKLFTNDEIGLIKSREIGLVDYLTQLRVSTEKEQSSPRRSPSARH